MLSLRQVLYRLFRSNWNVRMSATFCTFLSMQLVFPQAIAIHSAILLFLSFDLFVNKKSILSRAFGVTNIALKIIDWSCKGYNYQQMNSYLKSAGKIEPYLAETFVKNHSATHYFIGSDTYKAIFDKDKTRAVDFSVLSLKFLDSYPDSFKFIATTSISIWSMAYERNGALSLPSKSRSSKFITSPTEKDVKAVLDYVDHDPYWLSIKYIVPEFWLTPLMFKAPTIYQAGWKTPFDTTTFAITLVRNGIFTFYNAPQLIKFHQMLYKESYLPLWEARGIVKIDKECLIKTGSHSECVSLVRKLEEGDCAAPCNASLAFYPDASENKILGAVTEENEEL